MTCKTQKTYLLQRICSSLFLSDCFCLTDTCIEVVNVFVICFIKYRSKLECPLTKPEKRLINACNTINSAVMLLMFPKRP